MLEEFVDMGTEVTWVLNNPVRRPPFAYRGVYNSTIDTFNGIVKEVSCGS